MVHCSPGSPSKRTYGSMTKSVPTCFELCSELLESFDTEHQAEVGDRHLMPVDGVGTGDGIEVSVDLVGNDLMAVEVPVGPPVS